MEAIIKASRVMLWTETTIELTTIIWPQKDTTDAIFVVSANAGEMPSSKQTYLYGLPGPREGIKLCPSNIYLVGAEKAM